MGRFVGIDLGTTYSVVAYVDAQGTPLVIPNQFEHTVTPSVIYFGAGKPLVGDEAKEYQAFGSPDVASFFKRAMGNSEFQLVFQEQVYTATDLSALVLGYLKEQAELYLKEPVTDAVITVPAYFKDPQRSATLAAGQKAGLNVLQIISEPTAAALTYGLRPGPEKQHVLIYDLGGGTFDISLVLITPTTLQVIATDGDATLGGKDWDDRLIDFLEGEFRTEFGLELVGEDVNELRVLAERLKHSLSTRMEATVRVQVSGKVGTYTMTRAYFEELTCDLIERTQMLTEQVLREVGLAWTDLAGVLPVGGSTRMPMVQNYILQMSGKAPMGGIHPEEAVGLGAAIQAAMEIEAASQMRLHTSAEDVRITGQTEIGTMRIAGRKATTDVIAHSLGLIVESADRSRYINRKIIQKNQAIPATSTQPFAMQMNAQGETELEVFLTQSESEDPLACTYLGRYVFTDFPATAVQEVMLDITYAYDKNGVVHISAIEQGSRKTLRMSKYPLPEDVPARFAGRPGRSRGSGEPLCVYLAFDVSGSMCGRPIEEAQKAARLFVEQCNLESTSIGLIAFSDRVHVDQQATHDERAIMRAIDNLTCGSTGGGNDADPFEQIYQLFANVQGLRYAVVLADGMWCQQSKAIQRAKRCHQAEMEIIAIGFGHADRAFLDQIASSSEQSLFTSMQSLPDVFSTIARELSAIEGSPSSSQVSKPSLHKLREWEQL